MQSAKLTITKYLPVLILALGFQMTAFSQENSPYSRYGLGDLTPNHNILTRGMGGISAGFSSASAVNFINPATYSDLRVVVFDIGVEVDNKTLKSITPTQKFTSTNLGVSYLQLGVPIKMKKANKKDIFWGFNLGLKPISKINYKILKNSRIPGVDTLETRYDGTGGLNEVYLGTGVKIKNFSIGFNVGYMFGNKDYSTKLSFSNDTVDYYQSSTGFKTNFSNVFFNTGVQYKILLKNKSALRIGAYGNLKQKLKATQDQTVQTVTYDAENIQYRIDSVYSNSSSGKVVYPATVGLGFTYQDYKHWLLGADFETTNWKEYRFFNKTDLVQNSWKVRVGAEYLPATENKTSLKKYFSFVRYRFGFHYGTDYVKVTNNLPDYAFTFGAGFPLKLRRSFYETQSSILNTAIEIGGRGDKKSNVRESTFKISIGLSLADIWFRTAKYE